MPSRQIDIHPEAVAEARAAAQWYRQRSSLAAEAFLAEIDQAIEKIAERPDLWLYYDHDTKRYLLQRFPFSVVYREISGRIQIIAIAHAKRMPGYWRNRVP